MATKKDKLIKDFLAKKWNVGDEAVTARKLLDEYSRNPEVKLLL